MPTGTVTAVEIGPHRLAGFMGLPSQRALGLVIFAHGSGSGRLSPRNQHVAEGLRRAGIATLLLDLLSPAEERNRANVFDIPLLASRLAGATYWAMAQTATHGLPIGYFGASTGAGAALAAAASLGSDIAAVVSRGGRPDLAGAALPRVTAPTLLIVGGEDGPVIDLNRQAMSELTARKSLVVVPGAGHLFEEPGTLDDVVELAAEWFLDFLPPHNSLPTEFPQFADRREAGRHLAAALRHFRHDHPVILALPRGGVPVAHEIAQALDAPLDVILVRKIGAPGHPELGIGAVVDGHDPQTVLNEEIVRALHPSAAYVEDERRRQLAEIERRRGLYRPGRPAIPLKGRLVIVVDDGVATGATVKAVLRALSRTGAARIVLAIPVAPSEVLGELKALADEIVCLASPEPFHAVGLHYRDFAQTGDDEVIALLASAGHNGNGLSARH
jgi:predicted phosphoribosyltransferase/dienelactone hydrolase